MESSNPSRVLIVANRTAATPALLDAVRQRAAAGPADFFLLVPNPEPAEWHPLHPEQHDTVAGHSVLALALPLLDEAAGGPIEGAVSIRHDPMDAIEETLAERPFDEIILSTLPSSVSRWLHLDLPRRVEHLGLPLTTIVAKERAPAAA
jgi:hypothetical protein